MGIWESLQGTAAVAATAIGGTGQAAGAAAEKVGRAAGAAIGGTGQAVGGAAEKVGRAAGAAIGCTLQAVGVAAEKVGAGASEGARRMKEAMPDREGWETIGRIAWRITDYALAEFTRPYTGGIPAYRFLKEELVKAGSYNKHNYRRSTGSLEGAETPDGVIKDFVITRTIRSRL